MAFGFANGYKPMNTTRVFRQKPWLNKRGREILNRSARRIAHYRPEFVTNPKKPTLTECLLEIQYHAAATGTPPNLTTEDIVGLESMEDVEEQNLPVDAGILTNLLGHGLTFQEAIVWFLYRYNGMDAMEVHLSIEGKEKAFSRADEEQGLRNVVRTLESAAAKIGVEYERNEERSPSYIEVGGPGDSPMWPETTDG